MGVCARRYGPRSAQRPDERGMSLPLVLGAMVLFSAVSLMLIGIARFAIRSNDISTQRTKSYSAVEAGANDFMNRLNAYAQFDEWNAAKTKPLLDRNALSSPQFPEIVKQSAFAQWVRVSDRNDEQFTYDVLRSDPTGVIFRVTGRANAHATIFRSVEYRISRKSKGSVALAVERPYTNAAGYAYIDQFRQSGDAQGQMAVNAAGGYLSLSDYETQCDNQSQIPQRQRWMNCFRPYMNRFDRVSGDLVTGAPFTVHGTQGLFGSAQSQRTGISDWPLITQSLEIVGGTANDSVAASKIDFGTHSRKPRTYNQDAARAQGRQTFLSLLPTDGGRTSPPAQFKELRRTAKPEQVCRFMGSTQVVLHGDDVYVRSPHTPAAFNQGSAPWCAQVADQFYGRLRDLTRPDVMFAEANAGQLLTPTHPTTWVRLTNVPTDAIFVVERIPPQRDCESRVIGDNDGWGNYTGVGFPANRDDSDPLLGTELSPYDCRNGDLFIEGLAAKRKTFTAEDNIYLTGGIRYSDRDMATNAIPSNSDDELGLVAQRNVFIYNPPFRNAKNRPNERYYRYPRTPFILPVQLNELKPRGRSAFENNQGPWSNAELRGWLNMPDALGPASSSVDRTTIPTKQSWLTMPLFDGVIVAETGAFLLENPLMHDRPVTVTGPSSSGAIAATVTGAVFSRYAPLLHIDYETAAGEVKMHGLNASYINDTRLERSLPPGFTGLSVTAYRLTGFAEVGGDAHLSADHQYNP